MKDWMKAASGPFYKELGKAIKKAREANRVSQQWLADVMDLSRPAVVNIEQGRQQITFYQWVLISDALGMRDVGFSTGKDFSRERVLNTIHAQVKNLEKTVEQALNKPAGAGR